MTTLTLLNPQTAASTANDPNLFVRTADYDNVTLIAFGLTAAEIATINVHTPAGLIQYSEAGVAVNLTATQPHRSVPVGPTYVLSKLATTGAVGLYVALDA